MSRRWRHRLLALTWLLPVACSAGDREWPPITYSVSLEDVRANIATYGLPVVSETPNAFLTDFFGIQVLRDGLWIEDIEALGRVTGRGDSALQVTLGSGFVAAFHLADIVEVNGVRTGPLNFAVIAGVDSLTDTAARVAAFWDTLDRAGAAAALPKPNPYFEEEGIAYLAMQEETPPALPEESDDLDRFLADENAVYLVPDPHGTESRYEMALALLEHEAVDWFALEMLDVTRQPALDVFLAGDDGSDAYPQAEASLLAYYADQWNNRFGYDEVPSENHYFRLILRARDLGKPVYALDLPTEYILFRHGEFPLGATTRNVVWARQVPVTGRGVVFGGGGHFTPQGPLSFQRFLLERNPDVAIYRFVPD